MFMSVLNRAPSDREPLVRQYKLLKDMNLTFDYKTGIYFLKLIYKIQIGFFSIIYDLNRTNEK